MPGQLPETRQCAHQNTRDGRLWWRWERIPPPKPRRDQDALREAAGPTPPGAGLQPAGFAGLQVRIGVLNGYTTLGIPVTEAAG